MRKFWVSILFICSMMGCDRQVPVTHELTDERLAAAACGSCHVMPDPSLLPKEQWKNVLPHMGLRLGIETTAENPFENLNLEENQRLISANVFPDDQLIDDSLWVRINEYFISNAPDSMELPVRNIPERSSLFRPVFPKLNIGGAPFISMVKFDENEDLFLADRKGSLMLLDDSLKIDKFTSFPRPAVDIEYGRDGMVYVLSIGDIYPNDRLTGAVATFDLPSFSSPSLIFDELPRPVDFVSGDIDADGGEDLLVCNFGNYVGDLSYYRKSEDGYEQKLIKGAPGATRAFLTDVDNDTDLDVIALFAQGDEGISIFYNEVVKFREKRVLRFHPLYGSNDMELTDMDNDGDLDIVLSNGDNGDHSITLKPYHGVRIFLNDGNFNFKEAYFYPFYGSSKVRVGDFDGDGFKDIVAASFFAASGSGLNESIVVLINDGTMNFKPFSVEGADKGRWMVMDSGDYDKDGDEDVVLGSFTLAHEGIDPEVLRSWQESGNHILVLENQRNP